MLRGFNENQIERFAEFSRREGVIVRFIEFMPLEEPSALGTARTWTPETVVTMDEILARLSAWRPSCGVPAGLAELPQHAASESARRFTFADAVWARSASLRRCPDRSADIAADVRITSDGALRTCASSRSPTTTSMARCGAAQATTNWPQPSGASFWARRRATTSASRASRSPRATWCTSAARNRGGGNCVRPVRGSCTPESVATFESPYPALNKPYAPFRVYRRVTRL